MKAIHICRHMPTYLPINNDNEQSLRQCSLVHRNLRTSRQFLHNFIVFVSRFVASAWIALCPCSVHCVAIHCVPLRSWKCAHIPSNVIGALAQCIQMLCSKWTLRIVASVNKRYRVNIHGERYLHMLRWFCTFIDEQYGVLWKCVPKRLSRIRNDNQNTRGYLSMLAQRTW